MLGVHRSTLYRRYDVADGRCHWTKRYLGKHDVFYKGFNEGKGIWGVWEIPATNLTAQQTGGDTAELSLSAALRGL